MSDATRLTRMLSLPPENRLRGSLVALLIVPAGIFAWAAFWSFGVIVGVVGIAVAAGAVGLYRWGSGGRIGYAGAGIVSAIIAVTLGAAFVTGLAVDDPQYFARALRNSVALPTIVDGALSHYTADIVISVLLAAVMALGGIGFAFHTAAKQRRELRNENVVLEPR